MKNLYISLSRLFNKKFLASVAMMIISIAALQAQNVTVTCTGGPILSRDYGTLGEAFTGINIGDHTGEITVTINASTNEGTTPATLNSSDADPALYTWVKVVPAADNIVVQGAIPQGFGLVQLNGADSVTIDGDNPNTAGTNRNLTFLNTALNTTQFTAVIRIATSSTVVSADRITIKNTILTGNVNNGNTDPFKVNPSLNNTFGIYAGGNAAVSVLGAPLALNNETANKSVTGTTINNFRVINNEINQVGRGIAFMSEATSVNNFIIISDNLIGGAGALGSYPYSTISSTVYTRGITVTGTESISITGNTLRNIMQYGNQNVIGIEFQSPIGTGVVDISLNNITGVVNNGTTSDARGIHMNAIGAPYSIVNNDISRVESSAAGITSGILVGTNLAAGTFEKNKIYSVVSHNLGGAVGINLTTAGNGMVIQNNFIYDIRNNFGNNSFASTRGVSGILINGGSNHQIYHNSIHLYGVSAATSMNYYSCLSIFNSALTGLDIRNNIFANTVSGGSASDAHVGIFMPFNAVATMNLTMNNNAFYTGTVAGKNGMAFARTNVYNAANFYYAADFNASLTTPAANWRSYSSALGVTSNDNASIAIAGAHPFISNTDLHIQNLATSSPLESGGAIVGVTVDIDNQNRPGPAGSVNGGGTLPDIGADEFDRDLDDKIPPAITVTPPVACGPGVRTVRATITDATGVPNAGIGLPRAIFRVGAGPWTAVTATYISPDIYDFTIGAGAVIGDVVQYYIVAQDNVSPTPNVIASPGVGAGLYTFNPPNAVDTPDVYYSYTVTASLASGVYTVGSSGAYDFATLTAAVAAYNSSCLDGPVVFNLMDATYSGAETFPITINANSYANGARTLTIKPNTTATITGNNGSAIIKLNGADYIKIDGSNNGTSSRDLTIINTNTNVTAATIWIASESSTNGATFNHIKNVIVSGSGSMTSFFAIVASNGTAPNVYATGSNNNDSISNCVVRAAQYGIGILGRTSSLDQNWRIFNNVVGSTTVANDKIGFRGIFFQNLNSFLIYGNTVQGVVMPSTFTSAATGIHMGTNVINGSIYNNRVSDIKQQNTSGYPANGIFLGSSTGSNNFIYNNFIWDVAGMGDGSATFINDNGFGIMVSAGSGYNIYYNSVNMNTNQTNAAGTTAAININTTITAANAINLRNNIFVNSQTNTHTRYAILCRANPSVFLNINNNDYYSVSGLLGFIGGSAKTDIIEWRLGTGDDANSLSADPLFISPTNLHVSSTPPASPVNGLALPIGTITTDIDGDVRSGTTPDIGADEFVAPDCDVSLGGTITVAKEEVCGTGLSTFLSASGYSVGEGLSYQWQYSDVSDTGPWLDIPGATNPTGASTGVINNTRHFQLYVVCLFSGDEQGSNPVTVTVNNPQITATSPNTRCGVGPVTIGATGSPGTTVNWYAAATGGTPLHTGTSYTPNITATTTFYASASIGGITETGGKLTPFSNSSFHTNTTQWGVQFNATTDLVLNSTVIYPTGTGNITIMLTDNAGNELASTPSIAVSGTGLATPVTIPLGFSVSAGNGYRLLKKVSSGITGLVRDISGATFPYNSPSGALSVISSWNGSASSTTYYWFYSINITTGCNSARTAVIATSTPAPAISLAATPASVCVGESTTITVSSGNAGYGYTWAPGGATTASINVSPASTQKYVVTANDAGTGCRRLDSITINVKAVPNNVVIVPTSFTICEGQSQAITATGGNSTGQAILGTGTVTNAASSTTNLPPYGNFWTGNRHQMIYLKSELDAMGVQAGASFTDLAFDVVSYAGTHAFNGFTIRLGHTTNTSFPNSTFLTSPTTLVYGPTTMTPAVGWSTHALAGFTWDGTSNLLVETYFTNCGNGTSTCTSATACSGASNAQTWDENAVTRQTTQTETRHIFFNSDGTSCNPQTQTTASSTTLVRPNIRLGFNNNIVLAWTPNNGTLDVLTGNNVVATPVDTTKYFATATNALGCVRSDSVTVNVNKSSASSIITANPAGPICAGSTVVFTSNNTNGGPNPTYQWYINSNPVPGATSSTYTNNGTLIDGDIVTMGLTSNAPCIVGNPFISNAITMTVKPVPVVSITGGSYLCANSTGNIFTSNVTPVGGTVTHSWTLTGNGTITSGTTAGTVTVTAGASGSFTLTDTVYRDGCKTVRDTVIQIKPVLPVSVTITGDNNGQPICNGTQVIFTATPTHGGTNPTYQWFVGASPVGTNSATFTTTSLVNGDIVTVRLTSDTACASGNPATSNGITMTVTGAAPASVTIAASTACAGQSVTITATPTNGGASPTYEWFVNTVSVQNSASATYTYTPVAGDQVYVIITSSLLCPNPNNATSNTLTITPNAVPAATPTATCTTLLTAAGQTTTLSANATAGGSATITGYQWYLGGVAIGGATAATYGPTSVCGNYTVDVTNSLGCTTTSGILTITCSAGPLPAGNYAIPATGCDGFNTIASAVTYINTNGILNNGNINFNIAGGYTETAPSGGFRITTTGTVTSRIAFRKAGGANPVITAFTPQTSGVITDAIFKLVGVDYITISGLTLQENAGNTNKLAGTNTMTEFGVALLQASVTNGAQNDSIINNTISLDRTYANSFGVYSNATHLENNPGSASSITSAAGANSNNKIQGNTISNVNVGISMVGSAAGGFHDTGNEIGGALSANGNTITNWGGLALGSTYLNNPAGFTYGILINNQINETVGYNTLTSAALTGTGIGTRGIHKTYSTAPTGTFTSNINYNRVQINTGFTGAHELTFIRSEGMTAATAGATFNINNNRITGSSAAGGTPTTIMIFVSSAPGTLNVNNDTLQSFTSAAGSITGISITSAVTANKSVSGNLISTITGAAAVNALAITGGTTSANISSNTIEDISAGGVSTAIATTGAATSTSVTSNVINNYSSVSSLTGIQVAAATNNIVSGNTLTNLTITGTANLVGIQTMAASTVSNNVINNLVVNSAAPAGANLWAMFQAANAAVTYTGNTISGLRSNAITGNGSTTGLLNGIYVALGTTVNISKNRLFDFSLNGINPSTAVINGIHINGAAVVNASNNYISDLTSPTSQSADALRGIGVTATTANATYNIYYNTIYLNASSTQTTFGTSGIYHGASATATTAVLNLRNNIIVNVSTAGTGAGAFTAALRRNAVTTANYATTSNNNIFYAGTPSAKNVLYYNGTGYQDIGSMQAAVATRESASMSFLPAFIDIAVKPYNLHLQIGQNCGVNGLAAPITGYTDDYDGDARDGSTPDIGADEINDGPPGVIGQWKGVNTDWFDPVNWCGGLPTNSTNVTIPAAVSFFPDIDAYGALANNITIAASASVTISAGGSLSLYGHMANSGTLSNSGQIIMNGPSGTQDFPGAVGTVTVMDTLVINKAAGGVNLNKAISIRSALLPTLGTLTLNNNNVTMISSATGTSRIGVVGTTNAFVYNGTGRFVVERYIATGTIANHHNKSWQLLATPATGQTINQAWQEGVQLPTVGTPGLGTIIVSDQAGATGLGFDIQTPSGTGTSLKLFDSPNEEWDAVPNTNATQIANKKGYMLLVRGDRTVQTSGALPTPTKLRITGQVYAPGTNAPASTTVGVNLFESVGNPYASAVDFASITKPGIANSYHVWDPTLGGGYGLGGWQAIDGVSGLPVLGGTPYYPDDRYVKIQSGQAFMVRAGGGGGTVSFTEASKTDSSRLVLRPMGNVATMKTVLFNANGLVDGNKVMFDEAFSSTVDEEDIYKLMNYSENFGILSGGENLILERRGPVVGTDTVHFAMSNVSQQQYQLKFQPQHMPAGLEAFIIDKFLGTSTRVLLEGNTQYDFAVTNDPASRDTYRFMLVFKMLAPVPVTYVDVRATKVDKDVKVTWKTTNEINIQRYEVEHSLDGSSFSKIGDQVANGSSTINSYGFMHLHPANGDHYYRIRSIEPGQPGRYSNIVKVNINSPSSITVYPNPVKADGVINVNFENEPAGEYTILLVDNSGRKVQSRQVEHAGGNATYNLQMDRSHSHGNYMLQVSDARKVKSTFKIVF